MAERPQTPWVGDQRQIAADQWATLMTWPDGKSRWIAHPPGLPPASEQLAALAAMAASPPPPPKRGHLQPERDVQP